MKRATLYTASTLWLCLPLVIFLLGWTPWWVGLPLSIAALGLALTIFRPLRGTVPSGSVATELLLLAGIVILVIDAGVGGFVWQNRWDHMFRNAAFRSLVAGSWPVVSGNEMLCYYIGFWLPPALAAKLTGSLAVGWAAQAVWGVAGLWLALRLLFDNMRCVRWRLVAVFLLFGGLDIVGFMLYHGTAWRWDFHLDAWSDLVAWQSNATMLCWVYNQVIPAWVGCMLIFNTLRRPAGLAGPAILAFMSISCPFPVVGLFPVVLWVLIRAVAARSGLRARLGVIFSPVNILAVIVALPVILFMARTGGFVPEMEMPVTMRVWLFAVTFVLEFGVWMPFAWPYISRHKAPLLLMLAAMLLCCTVGFSLGSDFRSRMAIPFGVFIMIGVCRFVCSWRRVSRSVRLIFLTLAAIASVTAAVELARGPYMSLTTPRDQWRESTLPSIFGPSDCRFNFVAPRR